MLLALDVGNTHTLIALCDGQEITHRWRMSTQHHRSEDELAALLSVWLKEQQLSFEAIDAVIIACVVPDCLFMLTSFARKYTACEPYVVGKDSGALPMKVKIDRPEELGADRLVNAYAAWQRYQRACIVIDFGTATTFDVVSGAGEYLGGVIAPGVNLSLEALSQAAARLPGVPIRSPGSVIGKNTTHAMQAGVYYGYLGMIGNIISQIRLELPQVDYVVATGGLATLYSRDNEMINEVDADLTIRGLILLHQAR